MARSLQEQLLKAGLATESSLKKARENNDKNSQDKAKNKSSKPKKAHKNNAPRNPNSLNQYKNQPNHQPNNQQNQSKNNSESNSEHSHHSNKKSNDNKNTAKPARKPRHHQGQSQKSNTTANAANVDTHTATNHAKKAQKKPAAKNNEPSLASLYRQRAEVERKEKEDEEARKREQARIKKQNRKKLRELVFKHIKNDDQANLRYNFVVGSNVKYVFVTEEQQNQLATGELAITFIDGKRCLIPADLHDQIKAIDPSKIVVIADANATQNHEDIPADLEQPSLAEKEALLNNKKPKARNDEAEEKPEPKQESSM